MAIQFDFDGIADPTKIHSGGSRPEPGRGMAIVTKWSEYTGANGKAHELELEIVAWTVPDSIGKRHTENIFHADKSGKGWPMKRLTCLAMAGGLFNANDIEQWKKAGMQPEFNLDDLLDRPLMIVLANEEDQNDKNKVYLKIAEAGLAFYHIKDPKTKDWPRNQGIYNRHAVQVGEWITKDAAPAPASKNPFAGKA